jgi:hypothetical protein
MPSWPGARERGCSTISTTPMPFVLFSPLAPVPVCLATPSNQVMMDVRYSCYLLLLSFPTSYQTTTCTPRPTEPYLCAIYRASSVDTWRMYLSRTNITISQSLDYQSTDPSRLCPLICKSITIARDQDFSPSPSVLCLQPARRLCCCTMLFLLSKSRVVDQATRSISLPPVFSTILTVVMITRLPVRCKYTLEPLSPLPADALCHCYLQSC